MVKFPKWMSKPFQMGFIEDDLMARWWNEAVAYEDCGSLLLIVGVFDLSSLARMPFLCLAPKLGLTQG